MRDENSIDRERLARVLGMLGSEHDGEVFAAARQAERLRKAARLSWSQILTPAPLPEPTHEREITSAEDAVAFCLDFSWALTAWEVNFCRSIVRRPWALSPKQSAVLVWLMKKCRTAEARAA